RRRKQPVIRGFQRDFERLQWVHWRTGGRTSRWTTIWRAARLESVQYEPVARRADTVSGRARAGEPIRWESRDAEFPGARPKRAGPKHAGSKPAAVFGQHGRWGSYWRGIPVGYSAGGSADVPGANAEHA